MTLLEHLKKLRTYYSQQIAILSSSVDIDSALLLDLSDSLMDLDEKIEQLE